MLQTFLTENFEYKKLSPEEQQKRGILGRLVGLISHGNKATRNGRLYSSKLWESVFNDPIMQERINTNCCFGELGHPADREETDMEKVCWVMDGIPKKDKDGALYAVFNIIDTPNGRILKTLCDYGCQIGASSRGSGELTTKFDGTEEVDPDSYDCQGWDAVILPALKEARMTYVTESLDKKRYNKTLRDKLQESLDKASDNDKRVMQEALSNLDINLDDKANIKHYYKLVSYITDNNEDNTEDDELDVYDIGLFNSGEEANNYFNPIGNEFVTESSEEEYLDWINWKENQNSKNIEENMYESSCADESQKSVDKEDDDNINEGQNIAVDNNEAIVEELQKLLNQNTSLEQRVIELQEKLSVCYTKEATYEEQIAKNQKISLALAQKSKQVEVLTEKLNKLNGDVQTLQNIDDEANKRISVLESIIKSNSKTKQNLKEDISSRDVRIQEMQSKLDDLVNENKQLSEQLTSTQKDNQIKKSQYSENLTKSNQLVEKYKRIAKTAVDKYVESQAIRLGVKKEEIKNRLPESYNFSDIDKICEDLKQYKVTLTKLPFDTSLKENLRITATPSKNDPLTMVDNTLDDSIDDQLLSLARLN